MAALVVLLVPAGGVAQGDATYGDILALAEVDVLGAVCLIGTVVFEGVLYQTEVYEADGIIGHFPTTAVDGALPGDGDVVLFDGEEEGCPAAIGVFDVVEGVERAKDDGTAVEVEVDPAFEIKGSRHIFPCGDGEGLDGAFTAIAGRSAVDGGLQRAGVEGLAVAYCPIKGCRNGVAVFYCGVGL